MMVKKAAPKPKLIVVDVGLTKKYGVKADKCVWHSWNVVKARNEDSIRTHREFVAHRKAILFICGVKATTSDGGWLNQCLAQRNFYGRV